MRINDYIVGMLVLVVVLYGIKEGAKELLSAVFRILNKQKLTKFYREYEAMASVVVYGERRKIFTVYFQEYQNWFCSNNEAEKLSMDGMSLHEALNGYVKYHEGVYPFYYIKPIALLKVAPAEPRQRHESQIKTP